MKYEQLKLIIQQANPTKFFIEFNWVDKIPEEIYPEVDKELYKITLADVLLAHDDIEYSEEENEPFTRWKVERNWIVGKWNLKDDSLDNQTDETKVFLTNIFS